MSYLESPGRSDLWVVVFRGVGGVVVPWLVVEKSGCGLLGVNHGVSGEERRVKGEEFARKGRLFKGILV